MDPMVTAIRRGAKASRWLAINSWRAADAIEGRLVFFRNALFATGIVALALLLIPNAKDSTDNERG